MNSPLELYLVFQRLPEVGPASYWRFTEEFSSLDAFFNAPFERISQLLKPPALEVFVDYRKNGTSSLVSRQARADLAWLQTHGIHLIGATSEFYPESLSEISRAPPLLYVWGDPAALSSAQIAIIGSRNTSAGGKENALRFSRELAASGLTVTSGLALGVDTYAHEGALQAKGKTIAVIGTGIDKIYPQRNADLARDIVSSGGAIVSEFPLGTGPLAGNFPQRNRIISGLSCGVLVVEAAIKSGSLITARFALQQNREVFAIPGSIHNPLSKGGHALIKEGAKLVETAQDVAEELQGYFLLKAEELTGSHVEADALLAGQATELSEDEARLLEVLGYDPVVFDVLIERAGIAASQLMALLMTLELKGLIENSASGYACVASSGTNSCQQDARDVKGAS